MLNSVKRFLVLRRSCKFNQQLSSGDVETTKIPFTEFPGLRSWPVKTIICFFWHLQEISNFNLKIFFPKGLRLHLPEDTQVSMLTESMLGFFALGNAPPEGC